MEWIDSVLREVAELPDRNSPEDWPEAMLVTGAELRQVIVAHAPAEAVNAMVMEALRVNHQWHIDFDGYPGSDLEAMNLAAIAAAEARQAGPVRLTEADLEECKRLADAGSPVPHMSWSQRLAFAIESAVLERNGLKPQAKWVPMMGYVEGVPVTGPKFTHMDGTVMGGLARKPPAGK